MGDHGSRSFRPLALFPSRLMGPGAQTAPISLAWMVQEGGIWPHSRCHSDERHMPNKKTLPLFGEKSGSVFLCGVGKRRGPFAELKFSNLVQLPLMSSGPG